MIKEYSLVLIRSKEYFQIMEKSKGKSVLYIDRNTGQIQIRKRQLQHESMMKQKQIPGVFGLLSIAHEPVLVTIDKAFKTCSIRSKHIFRVEEIQIIPLNSNLRPSDLNYEQFREESKQLKEYIQGGFLFSYEHDLTNSLQFHGRALQSKYCWNMQAMGQILKAYELSIDLLQDTSQRKCPWFTPIIQGSCQSLQKQLQGFFFEAYILSRRSKFMGGTRFKCRGLDVQGNASNQVETELILIFDKQLNSFSMIRGSVPFIWQQQSVSSPIQIRHEQKQNRRVFELHMKSLLQNYKNLICIDLLSASNPNQVILSKHFKILTDQLAKSASVKYMHFDYHYYSKKKQFTQIDNLVNMIINESEYYVVKIGESQASRLQKSLVRVNCLDCMDRTNIIISRVCQKIIQNMLINNSKKGQLNFKIIQNSLREIFKKAGDFISMVYSGTDSTLNIINHERQLSFFQKAQNMFKSVNRYIQNNFYDDIKHNSFTTLRRLNDSRKAYRLQLNKQSLLRKKQIHEGSYKDRSLLVITYNCGNRKSQIPIFPQLKTTPELIIVCLQQICELNTTNILLSNNNNQVDQWRLKLKKDICKIYGDFYLPLSHNSMVGVLTVSFRHKDLFIQNFQACCIKTGASGYLGNKGAVAISFQIDSDRVVFFNVHLNAGEGPTEINERKNQIKQIMNQAFTQEGYDQRIRYQNSPLMFIGGDFNFRLKMSFEYAISLLRESGKFKERDEEIINQLFRNDQLQGFLRDQYLLPSFTEGSVKFLPSYKYVPEMKEFDTKKRRTPSWCDRILSSGTAEIRSYQMLDYILQSDHRPVVAQYCIRTWIKKPTVPNSKLVFFKTD